MKGVNDERIYTAAVRRGAQSVSGGSRIGPRCNWKDGKKQRIEECLNAVVANLIILAARERESTVENEREEKNRRREAHRRKAEERRQARQKARISKLGDDLFHWQKSQDVTAYLAEVRMAAEQRDGGIDPNYAQPGGYAQGMPAPWGCRQKAVPSEECKCGGTGSAPIQRTDPRACHAPVAGGNQ